MAYTIGQALKMLGTYWMQNVRVAYVENLKSTVVVALKNYKISVKTYPQHVVVFRGGLSEGEFAIVSHIDVCAINSCMFVSGLRE